MYQYFDTHVLAPETPATEIFDLPRDFGGALLCGPHARQAREAFTRHRPEPLWRHVETLDRMVGETHASFPSRIAEVIELDMGAKELYNWLRRPSEWWPLCDSLRNTGRLVRLPLPAGTRTLAAAKTLIRKYSKTLFLLDPFLGGPDGGWQGHVRLAEADNCFLTTLGLRPVEWYREEEDLPNREELPDTSFIDAVRASPPTPPAFKPITGTTLEPGREDGLPTSGFMPAAEIPQPELETSIILKSPPRQRKPWKREQAEEALYYAIGEVGAGKVLYAGGFEWDALTVGVDRPLRQWLEDYKKLDDAEKELILCGNARLLFKAKGDLVGEFS